MQTCMTPECRRRCVSYWEKKNATKIQKMQRGRAARLRTRPMFIARRNARKARDEALGLKQAALLAQKAAQRAARSY